MSRWSAERVRIGLAPERVDVAHLGTRLGRGPARATGADCTSAPGQPAWRAALDALQAPLDELDARGQSAAVVLSNHFVRYLVLPWQAELGSAAEVEQWARLRFEQTYGAVAAEWTIRCCDGGWGRPLVACAVDSALLEQLGERLAGFGLRLGSVQPLLMAAYNDARRGFTQATAFAVVEAGRVCLGLLEGGCWREISSRRTGADAADTVEQELATLDADADTLQLDVLLVGAHAAWPANAAPGARVLGPALGHARPTLALCGVA